MRIKPGVEIMQSAAFRYKKLISKNCIKKKNLKKLLILKICYKLCTKYTLFHSRLNDVLIKLKNIKNLKLAHEKKHN